MTLLATEALTTSQADLIALARREQTLLTAALSSLFTRPDLDEQISHALGYPDWPQPLTLLPALAPRLTTATPQLAVYLAYATAASRRAIAAVAEHGWPNQRVAADAAW